MTLRVDGTISGVSMCQRSQHKTLPNNFSIQRLTSVCLVSSEGEEWLKMRSVLRQLIMRPRDVAVFSDDVNKVVDDLIKRVFILRSQESDGATVTNVNDLFFKYAMEGR